MNFTMFVLFYFSYVHLLTIYSTLYMAYKKLTSIVDTVILCGCRGMALRRPGNYSQYHQKIGGYSTSHVVNFIDMLKIED